MLYIGIDPGQKGGIAAIDNNKIVILKPMPVIKLSNKCEIDLSDLKLMISNLKNMDDLIIAIESVNTMPKQGIVSSGNFMKGFGMLIGLCAGMGIPYLLVRPQIWKSKVLNGTDKSKGAAILRAKQIFPSINLRPDRCKKDQDGLAEALMIALYAKMENGK